MEMHPNVFKIGDDVWIDIFCFLSFNDLSSVHKCCHFFHKLTNFNNTKMNGYWRIQSNYLCKNIDKNFKTKNWYLFYFELWKLIFKMEYINNLNKNNIKESIYNGDYLLSINLKSKINENGLLIEPLFQACQFDCLEIFKMLLFSNNSINNINNININNIISKASNGS